MSYKSPIEIICENMKSQMENGVYSVVQSYGINVDKEELIKALQYDRDQYRKGYEDAQAESERKKGKWKVQPSIGNDRPFTWWKCSECGNTIYSETEHDRREFHAFCGRCGAEMRGE